MRSSVLIGSMYQISGDLITVVGITGNSLSSAGMDRKNPGNCTCTSDLCGNEELIFKSENHRSSINLNRLLVYESLSL